MSSSDIGNVSPIAKAETAVKNLQQLCTELSSKLANYSDEPKCVSKLSETGQSSQLSLEEEKIEAKRKKPKAKPEKANYPVKRRRNGQRKKPLAKLTLSQPYQLRQIPERSGVKKVFGFGSFTEVADKPNVNGPKRVWKQPDWRTRAMLARLMKQKSQMSQISSVTRSTTVSKKSSVIRKISKDPPDEAAALKYLETKPKTFIPCSSASRSFNLLLNFQALELKETRERKVKPPTVTEKENQCPALHGKSPLPENEGDKWTDFVLPARCTCFPGVHERLPVIPKVCKSFNGSIRDGWSSVSWASKDSGEGLVKELQIKEMKERLISQSKAKKIRRDPDGLKMVLKRIHSFL